MNTKHKKLLTTELAVQMIVSVVALSKLVESFERGRTVYFFISNEKREAELVPSDAGKV